jgi:hypothetical protein
MCTCNSCNNITVFPGNDANNVIVEGANDIIVTSTTDPVSGDITYTVGRPKEFFYDETLLNKILDSTDPNFVSNTFYKPTGYTNLTYTNSTSITKDYKVFAGFDSSIIKSFAGVFDFSNDITGGIIKTVGATDTLLWQKVATFDLSANLFWGAFANQSINSGSPIHLLQDNQGFNLTFKFANTVIPLGATFFTVVTLNAGESVSLQFKTKESSADNVLRWAQMMVEEI